MEPRCGNRRGAVPVLCPGSQVDEVVIAVATVEMEQPLEPQAPPSPPVNNQHRDGEGAEEHKGDPDIEGEMWVRSSTVVRYYLVTYSLTYS